jgi:hypothetical protein
MPAAISVKKLAQKSIMLLKYVPPPGGPGGAPAAKWVSLEPVCGGKPGEIDSDLSEAMKADSLPDCERRSVAAILSIHPTASQQISAGILQRLPHQPDA